MKDDAFNLRCIDAYRHCSRNSHPVLVHTVAHNKCSCKTTMFAWTTWLHMLRLFL